MDEKKKLMVLGGLFVVLIGVGVFVMRPKGEDPQPAPKEETTAADLTEKLPIEQGTRTPGLTAMGERDPFSVPLTPATITPRITGNAGKLTPPKVKINGSITDLPPQGGGIAKNGEGMDPNKVVTPAIPPFTYTVSGVVIGRKPAAVFKDAQGNQKLISQGSKLDEDTKVESINLRFVAVSYHGKPLKVPVGETQSQLEGGSSVAK
jgi:hypothetical protein